MSIFNNTFNIERKINIKKEKRKKRKFIKIK